MKTRRPFLVAAGILIALDVALSVGGQRHAIFVANIALSLVTIWILCAVHRRQQKTRRDLLAQIDRLEKEMAAQREQYAATSA